MRQIKNIAMIIAGGVGQRTHQDIPKQFIHVNDVPIIIYTLKAFQAHPLIDSIFVVCLSGWKEVLTAYSKQFDISKLEDVVEGGETGQDSIRNGLFRISDKYKSDEDIVLIHDAIRPMVGSEIISDSIRVCREKGNATTVIPCTSVMLKTDDSIVSNDLIPRDNLKITQTPQTFFIKELVGVHKKAIAMNHNGSVASCSLYVEMGMPVYFSKGSEKNIKITTSEDIEIFKSLLDFKRPGWLKE